MNFEEYIFILDIHCQQLGNMCQLNIYICIGYILPTIGGYMTVGGCLCALRALGWGKHVSVEYIYLYWIYSANIWGIYGSWRVSVRPSGAGLGNKKIIKKISMVSNCMRCQIVRFYTWCQIVRGVKLSWCQIVRCQIVRGVK